MSLVIYLYGFPESQQLHIAAKLTNIEPGEDNCNNYISYYNFNHYIEKGNEKKPLEGIQPSFISMGAMAIWDTYPVFLKFSKFDFAPENYDNRNLILLDTVTIPTVEDGKPSSEYSEEKITKKWIYFKGKNRKEIWPLPNREFSIEYRHCGTIIRNVLENKALKRPIFERTDPGTTKPNDQMIITSICRTFQEGCIKSKLKPKDTHHYLENLKKERKAALLESLQIYKKERESKSKCEYINIFGWGFSKTVKLSAVDKAISMIQGNETKPLTNEEQRALFAQSDEYFHCDPLYDKFIRPYGTLLEEIIGEYSSSNSSSSLTDSKPKPLQKKIAPPVRKDSLKIGLFKSTTPPVSESPKPVEKTSSLTAGSGLEDIIFLGSKNKEAKSQTSSPKTSFETYETTFS